MKNLKNFLKPRNLVIGATMFLSACGVEKDYAFNLAGLKPWMRNAWFEVGESMGIDLTRDDTSDNRAYLGTPTEGSSATIYFDSDLNLNTLVKIKRKLEFTIIFNKDLDWGDCKVAGDQGKYDFRGSAEHELYHARGIKIHSYTNPKDPLYAYASKCP